MTLTPLSDEQMRTRALHTALLLAALGVLAWLSVALDGFRWGLGNNALQAPILQRAVDPALFPDDPFIDTLDKYTSGIWWVLAQIGRVLEVRDWEPVIFVLHVASRLLFLAGLHALASAYVRDRRVLFVSIAVVAFGSALRGASVVGVHGLMGRVPDHTALANACALFALAAAVRGRHVLAAALSALVFDINAFVGAWLLPVVVVTLYASRPTRQASRRSWLVAGGTYAAVASPVAVWILSAVAAPRTGGVAPFDYRAFLRDYFPKHFFIDSAGTPALLELATIVAVGVVGAAALGPTARALRACYGAWIVLFLLGAAAPYLTSSPSILNLHLLRMDAFLMMLAAVTSVVCAVMVVERRREVPAGLAVGAGILAGLGTGYWWLTLAGVGVAGVQLSEDARLARWRSAASTVAGAASAWILFDQVAANFGMVIASTLALTGVFLVTRASIAAAFALVTVFSWTQQPKAVGLSLAAIAIAWIPVPDASRRRLLTHSLLFGTALLGLVRAGATEPRLLLGLVLASLLVEPLWHRTRITLVAARSSTLGYATLAGLIGLGVGIELWRPGPKDPFAAEIAEWREVQEWAKANTRIDDVFVVPDWPDGFGVWAERSIWVDWKHGAAVMWDPAYYWVYRERRQVQAQTTDPRTFARTTGVCFAVADVAEPGWTFPRVDLLAADLPVVFRNGRFAVVELCRDRTGATPEAPRPGHGGPA